MATIEIKRIIRFGNVSASLIIEELESIAYVYSGDICFCIINKKFNNFFISSEKAHANPADVTFITKYLIDKGYTQEINETTN